MVQRTFTSHRLTWQENEEIINNLNQCIPKRFKLVQGVVYGSNGLVMYDGNKELTWMNNVTTKEIHLFLKGFEAAIYTLKG